MNVNNLFIMSPSCEIIFKQIDKLSDLEGTLLNTTRSLIASLETDRPRVSSGKDYSGSHFGLESARLVSGSNRMTNFESKGYFISKFDNDNFTARSPSFPNQWARVFVTTEAVTFVYRNGGLLMKPRSCLMKNEKQLVDEIRELVMQGDPSKSKPRRDNRQRRARATQPKGFRTTLREKYHSIVKRVTSLGELSPHSFLFYINRSIPLIEKFPLWNTEQST